MKKSILLSATVVSIFSATSFLSASNSEGNVPASLSTTSAKLNLKTTYSYEQYMRDDKAYNGIAGRLFPDGRAADDINKLRNNVLIYKSKRPLGERVDSLELELGKAANLQAQRDILGGRIRNRLQMMKASDDRDSFKHHSVQMSKYIYYATNLVITIDYQLIDDWNNLEASKQFTNPATLDPQESRDFAQQLLSDIHSYNGIAGRLFPDGRTVDDFNKPRNNGLFYKSNRPLGERVDSLELALAKAENPQAQKTILEGRIKNRLQVMRDDNANRKHHGAQMSKYVYYAMNLGITVYSGLLDDWNNLEPNR